MAVAICDPVGDHDSERMLGARLDGRPADSEKSTGLRGLKVGEKLSFLSGREVLGAVAAMGAGMFLLGAGAVETVGCYARIMLATVSRLECGWKLGLGP